MLSEPSALMKLIKTVFRNRMGNKVLQQLMTICMNRPKKIEVAKPGAEPTEFDEVIDAALTMWSAGPVVRDALVTPQRRSAANRA